MTTFALIFFVFAFSALSVQSEFNPASLNYERIRYCEESRFDSRYPPTPVECCDERAKCNKIILPKETKYNLTNPDPLWSRRQCICDFQLYECVTKNLDEYSIKNAKRVGFSRLICFREYYVRNGGSTRLTGYVFTPFLTALSRWYPTPKKTFNPRNV